MQLKGTHITQYQDLDDLLGINWHVRGLNPAGDCCYPILDTIRFYIRRRRALIEYAPLPDESKSKKVEQKQGFILVFLFVRGDGLSHDLKSMYWSDDK